MKKERRWLIDSIRNQMLPEFARRDFEIVKLHSSEQHPIDRELIASLPFGLLRRRTDRGIEQIEINLSAHGRAAFNINIGIVPDTGIESSTGYVEPERVLVTWLDCYFVLCARRRFFAPFSVRHPWWSRLPITEADYEQLVDRVVALLPEVDQALSNKKIGPHIRKVSA